jgi:hypothetical protein
MRKGEGEKDDEPDGQTSIERIPDSRRMSAAILSWLATEPTMVLKIARWRTLSVIYSLRKSMGTGGPESRMQLGSSSSEERAIILSLLMAANLAVSSAARRSAEEPHGR